MTPVFLLLVVTVVTQSSDQVSTISIIKGTRAEAGREPGDPLHQLQPRHAEDGQERGDPFQGPPPCWPP